MYSGDLAGLNYNGNPLRGEGGDVEQVARISKQSPYVCDCLLYISYLFNLLSLFA